MRSEITADQNLRLAQKMLAQQGELNAQRERILAVLPDLDALIATHTGHCDREPCPARVTLTRIRRTLTGEDHPRA